MSKVQSLVRDEIEGLSKKPTYGKHVTIINQILAKVYEGESNEIKEEVRAAYNKHKAALAAQKHTDFEKMTDPEKLLM